MATIVPSVSMAENTHKPRMVILWETLTESDSIDSIEITDYTRMISDSGTISDMIIQVVGTFGGATVTPQQSVDGTNWVTAKDMGDTDVTFTSDGSKALRDDYRYFRVTTSGGSSQDVDIYLQINTIRYK